MVIHDLDLIGVAAFPAKANPPLVIDSYAVLSRTIAFERLQPIARRNTQGIEPRRGVKLRQLAPRYRMNAGRQPAHARSIENSRGVAILKGLDHQAILTHGVNVCKSAPWA